MVKAPLQVNQVESGGFLSFFILKHVPTRALKGVENNSIELHPLLYVSLCVLCESMGHDLR